FGYAKETDPTALPPNPRGDKPIPGPKLCPQTPGDKPRPGPKLCPQTPEDKPVPGPNPDKRC
ncbi:MAG TPA: hypothetical protein PK156_47975, partial [Polyangium sp.]|nr:hypothetical protein [Polyangium sp.]